LQPQWSLATRAAFNRGDDVDKYQQAEADLRHLKPKHDAVHAGLYGFFAAGLGLSIFMGLAGLDPNRFGLPMAAVIGLAYLGPWLYYRSHWNAYFTALHRRTTEIDREVRRPSEVPN